MNRPSSRMLLAAAISLIAPSVSLGIAPGQIDTFEDGTTQGWSTASVVTPPSRFTGKRQTASPGFLRGFRITIATGGV